MPDNKDLGSRLSEQTARHIPSDKTYADKNRERIRKLMAEPKVEVYGNPLYATYLGDVYSFDYQDNPVTIVFDGKMHKYPATIAKILQEKLDASARANMAKNVGDGDKLY